jgi:ankyrin repeat protein
MTTENGAIDIARLLLDAGADPNIRDDKFKATAIGWADYFGRADFAELLRAKGGTRAKDPMCRQVPLGAGAAKGGSDRRFEQIHVRAPPVVVELTTAVR